MDFTADGILARMKGNLKNEDSRIEGSFTMDNLQAVSEELARFNAMLIAPLQDELAAQGSDMGTSGNEKHYVKQQENIHERTEAENCIRLFQLRGDKPSLDGPLPQLRQLEHDE